MSRDCGQNTNNFREHKEIFFVIWEKLAMHYFQGAREQ